ncbi:MAG: tRNA lysidine(34) synthetase TilS [Vibrio sp.]
MSSLYTTFEQQLSATQCTRFVLAFSGGVDSRVLLDLLARYQNEHPCECFAVHVHHGLSCNADEWAEQCQRWGEQVNIPVSIEYAHIERESGMSLEHAARDARYALLAKHMSAETCLLLGQHADDQLETFLLAMKRGSGPKGLAAMARRDGFAGGLRLRPLLAQRRCDIEEYAEQQQLHWVTDESNQDERFDRNFLRHQITPSLTARWPNIYASIQRSAELCAEQEEVMMSLLENKLDSLLHADMSLTIQGLGDDPAALRHQLFRRWLSMLGVAMPSRRHTHMIWNEVALAASDANPILNLGQHHIRRFQGRLYCVRPHEDVTQWQQTLYCHVPLHLPSDLGTLCLQEGQGDGLTMSLPSHFQPSLLRVSFDPSGREAKPEHRAGRRKLKKLYQEMGIPSWHRRQYPIILYDEQVVAVAGLFVSQEFSGQGYTLMWQRRSLKRG